jgi:hypothetical protein
VIVVVYLIADVQDYDHADGDGHYVPKATDDTQPLRKLRH